MLFIKMIEMGLFYQKMAFNASIHFWVSTGLRSCEVSIVIQPSYVLDRIYSVAENNSNLNYYKIQFYA